jgi:hypothetical protein
MWRRRSLSIIAANSQQRLVIEYAGCFRNLGIQAGCWLHLSHAATSRADGEFDGGPFVTLIATALA